MWMNIVNYICYGVLIVFVLIYVFSKDKSVIRKPILIVVAIALIISSAINIIQK